MPIDPSSLSGKVLWLRAKDLAAGAVTSWPDQSGNGATKTGNANSPTVTAGATPSGGKAVVSSSIFVEALMLDMGAHQLTATASSSWSQTAPFMAINGNTGDTWVSPTPACWFQVKRVGAATAATSYGIWRPANDSQSPKSWTFQGSMDGSSWTDIDTRTGILWTTAGWQDFTFANTTAYVYYRVNITANNGDVAYTTINEFRLDGVTNTTSANDGELWAVVKSNGGSGPQSWQFGSSSSASHYTYGGVVYDDFGATSRQSFTPTLDVSQWRLYRVAATGTSWKAWLDNTQQASATITRGWRASNLLPLNSFNGSVAEMLVFNRALTLGEVADLITYFNAEHGLTVAGGSTGTTVSTATGAGPVAVASSSAAMLVNIARGSGPVSVGSSSTATLIGAIPSATGTSPVAVGSSSASVLVVPAATITTGTAAVTVGSSARTGIVGAADAVTAHSTTRITSAITAPRDVDNIAAHSTTRITSSATVGLNIAIDPVTGRPQYRLIVVDAHGTPLGELENASIGDPVQKLGQAGTLPVSLPSRDPKATLLDVGAQVQVWAGSEMLPGAWFVLVQPGKDGSGSISYDFVGLEGLLDNVVIGDERPELLKNGGFEEGLRYWHPTWLEGSAAQAPPKTTIVGGSLAKEGGKALQVEAVESVNVREVKTAAIFYGNRPSASEPLAAGFLPGGEKVITDQLPAFSKGTALLVEGFTADVDSGDGQALSQRRAEAARAVIVKARPDLKVTAVGRGETIQVAPNNTPANQAKNRRILLTGTATRVGHRQIIQQFFKWTNTSRVPIELELDGWINLLAYVGPSKDRYGFYINRRNRASFEPDALPTVDEDRDLLEQYAVDYAGMTLLKAQAYDTKEALYAAIVAATPSKPKIVQAEHTDLPEDFPHERWTPDGTSEMFAPPDGKEHLYEVRLYGSAGKTIFDEVSVKPNLRTGFYNVTRPQLFAGLVAEAQNTAHGKVPLNLEANCPAWGVHDDYEYEWKTPRTVWDAIDEQLRADDAPDFGIITTQTRRIATTWAKRGRRSEVQFRLGEVVTGYTAGVDGDKVATTGIVTSNRSRGPGVVEARVRTAPVNGLVFERVQAAEPDRSRTRLRQMATAMTRYGRTDVLTSVTCDPKRTIHLLGHVGLGDRVWCSVHDGDTHAEGWYRIVEIRHSLAKHQLSYELTPEV